MAEKDPEFKTSCRHNKATTTLHKNYLWMKTRWIQPLQKGWRDRIKMGRRGRKWSHQRKNHTPTVLIHNRKWSHRYDSYCWEARSVSYTSGMLTPRCCRRGMSPQKTWNWKSIWLWKSMGNMLKKTKKLQGTITEHLLKGLHADTLDLKISVKIPHLKVHESGTSLIIQCLRICTSITGNMGSIPGQGIKNPQATWQPT